LENFSTLKYFLMEHDVRPMAPTTTTSRPSAISSSTSYTTSTSLRLPRRVRLDIVPETIYENDEGDDEEAAENGSNKDGTNSSEIEYYQSHHKVGYPPSFFSDQ
jgi:hypothetical protein